MAGDSSNRGEEFARISRIEKLNQPTNGPPGVVKHSGIGTSLTKNSTNSGGINRGTKGQGQTDSR